MESSEKAQLEQISRTVELVLAAAKVYLLSAPQESLAMAKEFSEEILVKNKETLEPFIAGMFLGLGAGNNSTRGLTLILFYLLNEELDKRKKDEQNGSKSENGTNK